MSDAAKEEPPQVSTTTPAAPSADHPGESAPQPSSAASATPTLNNLLTKPSSAESTPQAATQANSGPPSNATVPFGSPQASPVANGTVKPQTFPPGAHPPQGSHPPHPDSYAATAAAVAAGAGSYPVPKNAPGVPGHPMYEQPPHMQGPPPHHVYYGQPPPHHPYWQQQMPPRYGPPAQGSPYYPPPQGYPPHGAPSYYPPPPQGPHGAPQGPPMHMQHRPPVPPPPAEYLKAQQQQRDGAATPAAIGGQLVPQSPSGNSSVAGEDALESAKSPSWAARGAAAPPQPSTSASAGNAAVPPGQPNVPAPAAAAPAAAAPGKNSQSIVDKLTGPVNEQNPPRVMADRRRFFENLVLFCEQNGDPITAPPQVSKQNIDLHRLYIAVRSKGGFMQVTKDKVWKNLCQQASSAITESSAAGYQLRRHYEKYLLKMECAETHRSYDEMIEFANKLKKKKKPAGDRDSTDAPPSDTGAATPATPGLHTPGPPSAASTPAPQTLPPPAGAQTPQQPPPQAAQPPPTARPGQGPPPPGYHAGPPPPGGDPNAAYYYPPQQQTPHGWPQGAPPPQGYPPYGAPRMPPPQASYEEQQRYYQQQQQHHQQQQAQMAQAQQQMPQQPPQQTPSSQAPSNTLQVDVAGGSQVNSRAPSTGPAAADTPDSSSQLSAPGEDAANRPQSRPSIAPTPPATLATQPPPQGYYPGPPPSTSYGSPRPPPLRPMYPMAADGASTSGAYPPGMYPPASHPQMWQQPQRYPGPQQMQPPQGYGQQRRPPYPPFHLAAQSGGPPGAPSPGSGAAAQIRARYGAQPPQQGPSQGATAPPQHQPGTPSMMPHQRGPSGAQMQGTPGHHAPATQAALSRGDQPQPQIVFPPGCVEATQPMLRKRRKILARELGPHVTPRRLAMSLRSGLDTELVWAINALNVILYDDTNAQVNAFSVVHAPELLTLAVEHLRATVNVLFPDVFQESEADQTKIPTIKDEEFWTRIEKEKQGMKQIVSATRTSDYNKVSRFGRSVRVEKTDSELPLELKRYRPAGFDLVDKENTNGEVPSAPKKKSPAISGTYLSERVTVSLKNVYSMECKLMKEAEVPKSINERKPEEPEVKTEEAMEQDPELLEEPALKNIEPAVWTELVSVKPTGLTSRFEALQKLVNRCLGLSNIIRGYSFLPGNEFPMSRHAALLFLIGRFLRLRCEEVSYATKRKERAEAAYTKLVEAEEGCFGQVNGNSHTKCVDVEDDARKIMDDLANQLRDDAFVILCHLSAQLNFFSYDSEVSWPIFDGLIHWICCKSITAKDPLVSPCVLTPRAYALEILCKMSVVEPNVDLLVATGPWNRFEEFVNRLAGWLAMSEEPHIREFSLVILNAICNISEEAAYFACLHTQALSHIVYFLEFTDTAMHTVVTQQGMMALRDSPELMGTSVGMLRRAATILHSFSKVRECRHLFVKQQQRLLALSMSQLMDSRVAQMIVETLFEVQQAESEGKPKEEVKIEPKEEEAAKEDEKADSSPSTAVSTNGEASAVLPSTSSPELKTVESPKDEEKPTTNGTPMSEGSPAAHSDDSLFRAPKMKKRPASPVVDKVLENGTNGNYAANKRRRLENGTNGGSKLNGVMDSNPSPSIEVDHTATTKNSMAAVA